MKRLKPASTLLLIFTTLLLGAFAAPAQSTLFTLLHTVNSEGEYTPVSVNGTASIATNGADFVELVSIDIDERGVGLFPTYELADVPGDTPFLLQLTFGDLDGATPTPLDLNTTVAEFLALGAPLQPWPQISYLPLTIEVPLPTIAEIAVATPELSTLVAAVTAASAAGNIDFLAAISDPDADLTVFAPTDDAFAALGDTLTAALADPGGLLTDVLAYHVLGTSEAAADLIAAGTATTLLGSDVAITVDDNGNVFINNSQVVLADVQAANGIVHVIDVVLLPPSDPAPLMTIAEIAVATPELSTLVAAVTAASAAGNIDFLAAISDPDADLTVFAPTDDAFAALGDTLTAALADPGGLLTDVLAYHVLGTSEAAADLIAAGTATTLLGSDVAITVDDNGNVFINNSQVIIADVQAANGIVHVIDVVLLPPSDDTPIFDCAKITLKNNVFGGFLTPNRRGNVVLEHRATDNSVWKLEDTGMGSFYLLNVHYNYYLDADSSRRRYNVDLGNRGYHGTEWNIMQRDNGTYVLQNVDYHRYLDGDKSNVDTSSSVRADDEWVIELMP